MDWLGRRIEPGTVLIRDLSSATIDEVKRTDETRFTISGYMSKVDLDIDRWRILGSAWRNSVDFWTKQVRRAVPMFFNHDRDLLIGRHPNIEVREDGLYTHEAEFDLGDPFTVSKVGQIERGFLWGQSVGFRVLEEPKYDRADDCLIFESVFLLEDSVVTLPANLLAQGAPAIGAQMGDLMEKMLTMSSTFEKARTDFEAIKRSALDRDAIRLAVAEEITQRIGTVKELVEAALKDHESKGTLHEANDMLRAELDELRKVTSGFRYENIPMDPGGETGGGGGTPPPQGGPGGAAGSSPFRSGW
jgi:HK97 family phage prohead protease